MTKTEIVRFLKSQKDPEGIEGQKRFGISSKGQLGIRMPVLRTLAKSIKKNHALALELWDTEIFDARLLAGFIADPKQVDESLMEKWVADFDNWAICDGICGNVFDKTPFAYDKAVEWTEREREFEKRAGFVLMATLSVHDKKADDEKFRPFFDLIKIHAEDDRHMVKKAVNWALRQIGKRSPSLYEEAVLVAEELSEYDSKSAKWIASDALREFRSGNVNVRQPKNKTPKSSVRLRSRKD